MTNQQYEVYVLASRGRVQPPIAWALELPRWVVDREPWGAREHSIELRKAKKLQVDSRFLVAAHHWWKTQWGTSWRDAKWRVPKGQELMPVVGVRFEEAQGYAAWAGLRLPTEFEFEHAVRGGKSNDYAWGKHWKPGYALTSDCESLELQPVGTNKRGRTKSGIDNLGGNAREWTSSRLVAYPGWEAFDQEDEFGRDWVAVRAWHSALPVVRGGSVVSPAIHAHASFRGGSPRLARFGDLGFRCVALPQAGLDCADAFWDRLQDEYRSHTKPNWTSDEDLESVMEEAGRNFKRYDPDRCLASPRP